MTGPSRGSERQVRARATTPARTVLDDDALELGSRVRERRHRLRLSLVEVARATGLSHPFLSQLERGHARPSMTSLRRIAAALSMDPSQLFDGSSDGRPPVTVVRRRGSYEARGWDMSMTRFVVNEPRIETGPAVAYVLRGHAVVVVDGKELTVAEGDAAFVADAAELRPGRDGDAEVLVLREERAGPDT